MSVYLIISAAAIGLGSVGRYVVGVVAVMRARKEDIPAVVRALGRASTSEDNARTGQSAIVPVVRRRGAPASTTAKLGLED